jgi:hypothetical protein
MLVRTGLIMEIAVLALVISIIAILSQPRGAIGASIPVPTC